MRPRFNRSVQTPAFSLVEVVLALGIASFCLVALFPLMTTGIKYDKETRNLVDASNTTSILLQFRRASPLTNGVALNFPLPTLPTTTAVLSNSAILIDATGARNTTSPAYALAYRMELIDTSRLCRVYLRLSSPAQAQDPKNQTHYEVVSAIGLDP